MNNLLLKIKDSKIETHKRVGEGFLDLHKILGDFEDLLIDTMNKQAAERAERVESFISHSSKKLYPLEGLLLYCKEALKEHNQGAFLQSVNHLTSQVVSIVDELYVPEDELKEDPYKSFRLGFGNVSKDLIDLLQSNLYHDEVERPRTPKLYINNKYPPEPPELLFQVEDTETMTKTYSPEPKQYKRVSKSPLTVPPSKVVQVKGENSFKMARRQEKRPRSTPPYQEDHRLMNTFHCHSGRSHDDLEALPSSRNFSVKVPDCLLPRPPIIYQHIMLEDTAKIYWMVPTGENTDVFDVQFQEVVSNDSRMFLSEERGGLFSGIKACTFETGSLNPCSEYLFRVRGVNTNGEGEWSYPYRVSMPSGAIAGQPVNQWLSTLALEIHCSPGVCSNQFLRQVN
ncbi:tripartite motif-containing protein 42-like isoform X1 [Acipenser ruthenus]|uniref:tripartite motif-containing protein 42-like isoform X1 n=1 Tax=Acipenser ruthenus TaxID=7906 RepID=UPI002740558D|nr:tripartite motif-containing protein 42-like isoform X1 [Acipenser ruthenus]